eukprot:TRINITY_DN77526_c0_g1_i1.p2 TRINITY_DN77526_c0_g1~~TRINITY_DN77526_c0_g1_i1.p2  ORF type:complete len:145 (+),score=1.98 TRINITY_DN77526_c0_g1_i1:148-582(+)
MSWNATVSAIRLIFAGAKRCISLKHLRFVGTGNAGTPSRYASLEFGTASSELQRVLVGVDCGTAAATHVSGTTIVRGEGHVWAFDPDVVKCPPDPRTMSDCMYSFCCLLVFCEATHHGLCEFDQTVSVSADANRCIPHSDVRFN